MADDLKHLIRDRAQRARATIPREQSRVLSELIERRALTLPCLEAARAVALYAPIGSEVATDLLAREAIAAGRRLFYPRILPASGRLEMIEVDSPDELRRGAMGVPAPGGTRGLESGLLGQTVVFVPGVAFGWRGQRLGRGGGYYDRFLSGNRARLAAVGLAYACQMMEVPEDEGDQRVDYIVTESACYTALNSTAVSGGERH